MIAKSTDTFIQELISGAKPAYKIVYVVALGYLKEYTFDNACDAITFARSALTSQDRDSEIDITIKKVYPEPETEPEQEVTEDEEA